MGTFTKSVLASLLSWRILIVGHRCRSFGAQGGYLAGKRSTIAALRRASHASVYAEAMAPPVVQQIVASMACIMGPEALQVIPGLDRHLSGRLLDGSEGRERLRRLAFNSRYLSSSLRKMGFIVYGHRDSPIVPLLIFAPGKLPLFSRLMLERHNIVVVVVAYRA
jgi:serine palmitoyltransferase